MSASPVEVFVVLNSATLGVEVSARQDGAPIDTIVRVRTLIPEDEEVVEVAPPSAFTNVSHTGLLGILDSAHNRCFHRTPMGNRCKRKLGDDDEYCDPHKLQAIRRARMEMRREARVRRGLCGGVVRGGPYAGFKCLRLAKDLGGRCGIHRRVDERRALNESRTTARASSESDDETSE